MSSFIDRKVVKGTECKYIAGGVTLKQQLNVTKCYCKQKALDVPWTIHYLEAVCHFHTEQLIYNRSTVSSAFLIKETLLQTV